MVCSRVGKLYAHVMPPGKAWCPISTPLILSYYPFDTNKCHHIYTIDALFIRGGPGAVFKEAMILILRSHEIPSILMTISKEFGTQLRHHFAPPLNFLDSPLPLMLRWFSQDTLLMLSWGLLVPLWYSFDTPMMPLWCYFDDFWNPLQYPLDAPWYSISDAPWFLPEAFLMLTATPAATTRLLVS